MQLDRSRVNVVRELKIVLIRLSLDSRIHQTIDIVVNDVPEAYGMWLSRDWSKKLKGYFRTYWSHLWIPYQGKFNIVMRERYIKQIVTDIDNPGEPVITMILIWETIPWIHFLDIFLPIDLLFLNLKLNQMC